jgi:pimeloyl-ACP methyl ester carboxylesterase
MTNDHDRDAGLVRITAGQVTLDGNLLFPEEARGIIVFAHGSGSSRFSARNRAVAGALRAGGLGTLLLDLLTPDEEELDLHTAKYRFDIELLAERVTDAVHWLGGDPSTSHLPIGLPIGLFGASTGGGAALVAAARMPARVKAVVSRGGRPDLAGPALPLVEAPTLLIAGGQDESVIALNEQAYAMMRCERRLEIVPGATHLFEEKGALERVALLARDWFEQHLD